MPTQKDILAGRLQDAISKKAEKRTKNLPASTPKLDPGSGKENQAPKSVKSDTPRKKAAKIKKARRHLLWAKPRYHRLTDQLLTIIEENPCYQQAFGFSKEPRTNPTTGGLTLADLYTKVASELFLADLSDLDLSFTNNDLPTLQNVKKLYREYCEELGQTGQGLVENDMVDEIQAGTPLANVWDHIKSKFPWYERLDKLFGSQATDDNSVDHEDKSSEPGSRSSSPPLHVEFTPSHTPAPKKAGSAHKTLATLHGANHKASIMDQITELANKDRSQRLKIIEVKQKEKTRHLQTKYQTQNELELACMRHQEQQAALQHQHDLQMMERQMELECIHTTANPQATFSPGVYHGPAYGGRFGVDPNLT
ncbi:hypothetical protein BYT27DRAFT_7261923 [Phlegmacium glaucopus]|nr:hypothetical protein BYT27DRAFT_7261923 [Phlegmacium glaucopus]